MAKSRGALIAIVLVVMAIAGFWWARRSGTEGSGSETTSDDPLTTRKQGGSASPVATARQGKRIAGTVLLDGAPAAGATVSLIGQPWRSGLRTARQVVTDASGHFDLGVQPIARYGVAAEKPGVTGAVLEIDLRDPSAEPAADQLRLVLHACDAALFGAIRDASGGPIAKASVGLAIGGRGAEADDEGRYEVCIPVGGAQLVVDADGYARVAAQVTAYGRLRRDFDLVPEAIVIGRVVRKDDRTPVAAATVTLTSDSSFMAAPATSTTSDDDGQFRVDGLDAGSYSITVSAEGLATEAEISVMAEVGAQEPVTCEVVPTVVVAGKVIERGSGTPIAGASVQFIGRRNTTRWVPFEATTQADGTFEITSAFPGELRASVSGYDGGREEIVVDKGGKRDIVLEVERRASIAGRVSHRGKPVDDAVVRTDGASTKTDADGRFVLRGVEVGERVLYAESKRLGAFTRSKPLTVGKAEHRSGVEIELDLSGSIEGVVVDQNEKPVGNVALELSLLGGRDFGAATTAEDGTFRVTALSGGGDYGYLVRSIDGSLTLPPLQGKRFPPIAVRDGQSRVTGVRIAVRYERLSIAGRVMNSKGTPVPDVLVRATPSRSRGWDSPSARTSVDGTFVIQDLPAGTYTLAATAARTTAIVDDVVAGRRDVVIALTEPGSIKGTVEGFSGTVTVVAIREDDRMQNYRMSVSGGSFELRNVSPGRYRVFATTLDGERDSTEATVVAGASVVVTFRSKGFGSLSATIVDQSGTPTAGINCNVMSSGQGTTDAAGRFRMARVPAGRVYVWCADDSGERWGQVMFELQPNEAKEARVVLEPRKALVRSIAGFETQEQLGEVRVSKMLPNSAAARAGLAVGDVVVKFKDQIVSADLALALTYQPPGSAVTLTVERDDNERTITFTLEAAP